MTQTIMDQKYETLITIFKNTEEAQKLLALTPEEASCYLEDQYDLEFTVSELNDIAAGMKAALMEDSDELFEDALDQVVGGITAYQAGYYVGKAVIALGVGVGIAAVMGW